MSNSALELKNLISTVCAGSPSTDMIIICNELLKRLPQSRIGPGQRGKVCPDCSHKMHNRRIKCPNCERPMTTSCSYRCNVPLLLESDCNICGNRVVESELATLECGHIYHSHCLSMWSESHSHCCHCREVKIPAMYSGDSI